MIGSLRNPQKQRFQFEKSEIEIALEEQQFRTILTDMLMTLKFKVNSCVNSSVNNTAFIQASNNSYMICSDKSSLPRLLHGARILATFNDEKLLKLVNTALNKRYNSKFLILSKLNYSKLF